MEGTPRGEPDRGVYAHVVSEGVTVFSTSKTRPEIDTSKSQPTDRRGAKTWVVQKTIELFSATNDDVGDGVGDLSQAVCVSATNLTTGEQLWPREADAEDIALAEQKRDTAEGIPGYLCISVLERTGGYGTSGGAVLKWVRGEIPPGSELRNGIVIQLFAQHGFFSPQQAKLGGASVYTTSPDGSTTTLVTEVNNENNYVSSFPDAEYMGVVYQWVRHVPAAVYGGGKDELASIWSGGGGRYVPVTSEQ